ncbi:MAG: hypothetical protein ABSA09_13040 [Desulfobaccales bacterium]|jgi:hypothetical protein
MKLSRILQNISLTFAAGRLGELLTSLLVWFFGASGLAGALGGEARSGLHPRPGSISAWCGAASGAGSFSCRWSCLILCGACSTAWDLHA